MNKPHCYRTKLLVSFFALLLTFNVKPIDNAPPSQPRIISKLNYGLVFTFHKLVQLPYERYLHTFFKKIPTIDENIIRRGFPTIPCETPEQRELMCAQFNAMITRSTNRLISHIRNHTIDVLSLLNGIPDVNVDQITRDDFLSESELHISSTEDRGNSRKKRHIEYGEEEDDKPKDIRPDYCKTKQPDHKPNFVGRLVNTLTGGPDWHTIDTQNEHICQVAELEKKVDGHIIETKRVFTSAMKQLDGEISAVQDGANALHSAIGSLADDLCVDSEREWEAITREQRAINISIINTEREMALVGILSNEELLRANLDLSFSNLERGLVQLKNGVLTNELIPIRYIQTTMKHIEENVIAGSGLKLAAESAGEFYGDRFVSSSFSSTSGYLHITVPFYLQPPDYRMLIYHVKRVPVQKASNQRVALKIVSDLPAFFGITESGSSFVEMSSEDLLQCNSETTSASGGSPVCDALAMPQSFSTKTCASTIFKDEKAQILSQCEMSEDINANLFGQVSMVSALDILIFDPTVPLHDTTHRWTFQCKNSPVKDIVPKVWVVVQLPCGCSLMNGTQVIVPERKNDCEESTIPSFPEMIERYPAPLATIIHQFNVDALTNIDGQTVKNTPWDIKLENFTILDRKINNSIELERRDHISYQKSMDALDRNTSFFQSDAMAMIKQIEDTVGPRLKGIEDTVSVLGDISKTMGSVASFFATSGVSYGCVLLNLALLIISLCLPK